MVGVWSSELVLRMLIIPGSLSMFMILIYGVFKFPIFEYESFDSRLCNAEFQVHS